MSIEEIKTVAAREKLGTRGLKRRAELISAANAILMAEGLEGLALRRVASEVNMTLGNLQFYFPTRDDLLEALFYEIWEKDKFVISQGSEVDDLDGIISSLIQSWSGEQGQMYLKLGILSLRSERFYALRLFIWSSFYDELVAFQKKIHPERTDVDLLRRAKLVTCLLDGLSMQVHGGSQDERRLLHLRLVSDVKNAAIKQLLD